MAIMKLSFVVADCNDDSDLPPVNWTTQTEEEAGDNKSCGINCYSPNVL